MIILLDWQIGYGDMDKMLAEALTTFKVPFITVLTKWDKSNKKKIEETLEKIKEFNKERSFCKLYLFL